MLAIEHGVGAHPAGGDMRRSHRCSRPSPGQQVQKSTSVEWCSKRRLRPPSRSRTRCRKRISVPVAVIDDHRSIALVSLRNSSSKSIDEYRSGARAPTLPPARPNGCRARSVCGVIPTGRTIDPIPSIRVGGSIRDGVSITSCVSIDPTVRGRGPAGRSAGGTAPPADPGARRPDRTRRRALRRDGPADGAAPCSG